MQILAVWVIAASLAPQVITDAPRDPAKPASPTGRAVIRGVVLSADRTPRPIRRAVVSLGGIVPEGRAVITDDDGRFAFEALPAGQFTVLATKAAFLPAAYGAMRPGRPGTPIALGADQALDITLTMARGAVISGTIRDVAGQPMSGVRLSAVNALGAEALDRAFTAAEPVFSDDRGQFRFFGLAPGDYIVAATHASTGNGEIGLRSPAEVDRLLAELQRRRALPAASRPATAPAPRPPSYALAPTYFPGTPLLREAGRVRVAAADVREGIDFVAGAVPVARVSGVVSGDVQNLMAVRLGVIIDGVTLPASLGTTLVLSQPPDAAGRFSYSNVAPGRYRIMARAIRGASQPPPPSGATSATSSAGGSIGGPGPGGPAPDYLYAVADVDVFGQDISGLSLVLQPGSIVSGRVHFDASTETPPTDLMTLRVSVSSPSGQYSSSSGDTLITNTFIGGPTVNVRAEGTFEVKGIGPGLVALSCFMPTAVGAKWWLRSAVVGGRDLLDAPFEIAAGMDFRDVVITLSDRRPELSGTLQTPAGQPAPEYYVIVFPADASQRMAGSRRVQAVRPTTAGRFVFPTLPPGDYVLAALLDVVPNEWNDLKFLEQVAQAGVRVTLGEGEKKVQDLRIAGGS